MKLKGDKVLSFGLGQVYFMPIVGLSFPPGVLAIAASLDAAYDFFEETFGDVDPGSVEFTIKGFREEFETWDIRVYCEDTFYDSWTTVDVRVIRDRNNYKTEVKTVKDV